jgi:hypothetical protein
MSQLSQTSTSKNRERLEEAIAHLRLAGIALLEARGLTEPTLQKPYLRVIQGGKFNQGAPSEQTIKQIQMKTMTVARINSLLDGTGYQVGYNLLVGFLASTNWLTRMAMRLFAIALSKPSGSRQQS